MVKSDDLFVLPPLERLKRYRELAAEAAQQSTTAPTTEVRETLLNLAHHWADLGTLLEKGMALTGTAEALPEVRETVPPKEPIS